MRIFSFIFVAMLAIGCDGNISDKLFVNKKKPVNVDDPPSPIVNSKFDAAAAADELANQAKMSSDSIAEDSSEVINGTLEIALKAKALPEDFVKKVREAVPGLSAKPPRDLTKEEIDAICAVR